MCFIYNIMLLSVLECNLKTTELSLLVSVYNDKTWSTEEGNGKPPQYSCLENPMNSMKGKKMGHSKINSPGRQVTTMLLEISGEITPERMKRCSQSKSNTQLWM